MKPFTVTVFHHGVDGAMLVDQKEFNTPTQAYDYLTDFNEEYARLQQQGQRRSAIISTPIGDFKTCPNRN
jgi:hypothetical protein